MNAEPHFVHRRRVEFSETDMAGIVHFANFYRWMEAAEVGWFESMEQPLIATIDGVVHGWPRVRSHCDFHGPASFRDEIEVHLRIKEVKIRAIVYGFRFYRLTDGEPEHVATGGMTTVFARRNPATGKMESASIPSDLLEAAETAAGE